MLMITCFLSCISVLAFACGDGGSGVSGSKTLVSLNADQRTDLCEYIVDVLGAPRTVTCDGETKTSEQKTVTSCTTELTMLATAEPNCPATVEQAENCFEALGDLSDQQICDRTFPPECAPFASASCK